MTWLVALALAALAGPFVLYPALLAIRARLWPSPLALADVTPTVTLVVCAHDERDAIAAKIENALALDYPADRLEICVASDGSTDGTVEIARGYEARGVRVLDLPRRGKAFALDAAVRATRSEVLAFSDANSEWEPGALRALVRPFADERVGGVAGDQRYRDRSAREAGAAAGERSYWSFDRALKRWQSQAGSAVSATGAIYAVRRALYEAPPPDATDDFMVSTAVIERGTRLAFAPEAVALEPPAEDSAREFRRKVRVTTRGLRAVAYRRALLDPRRTGFYAILLFTHKLWRRLTWIPLALLFLASPFCIAEGGWLALLGAGVTGGVLVGALGLAVPVLARLKPVGIAAYVVMVNAACAVATANAVRGRRVATWQTERASEPAAPAVADVVLRAPGMGGPSGAGILLPRKRVRLSDGVTWVTPAVLFLVYLNAPVVAVHWHGAPFFLAAAVPLSLGIPVLHRVLVRGEPFLFPQLLVASVVMLTLHAVSALASERPAESMEVLETWLLEGVLIATLVVNAVRTRDELRLAVQAVVAAGAVMGGIAILQQLLGAESHGFYGFGQLDAVIGDGDGGVRRRLAGPIGETNRFAQVMAVLIPVAAACAVTTRGRERLLWAAAGLLITGGMAFAFSRGAIVALAVALPFALLFRLVRVRQVVVAVVAGVVLLAAMPQYAERVLSIGEVAVRTLGLSPVGMRNADGAARGRITEMQAAGMLFLEHPLLGAGPGLAPRYYAENARVTGGKVRPGERRSHNLFLQIASETGVVGLAAFLFVLAIAFRDLDRARRRVEQNDLRTWAFVVGLELALIVSLTASVFLHAAYIRYFWLLLGLGVAASRQAAAPVMVALLSRIFRQTAERIQAGA